MKRLLASLGGGVVLLAASPALADGNVRVDPNGDRFGIALPDGTVIHPGHWWDPYGPNALKGDRPVIGENTFLVWTTVLDSRGTADAPPGSTARPIGTENALAAVELFHGLTVFRPKDWRLKASVVSAVVRDGGTLAPQQVQRVNAGETFAELLLASWGHASYDSTSLRAGAQAFSADFEGLVLNDALPGARNFANWGSNRFQTNFFYGRPFLKGDPRFLPETLQADVASASLFIGDAFAPGFNLLAVAAYDDDRRDKGRREHVGFAALASNGHAGRIVTQSALYLAAGTDVIAGASGDVTHNILAPMGVLDLALPMNAWNPRLTALWAPGDSNPADKNETAFDSIADKVNFAGADGSGILGGVVGGGAANKVAVPQVGGGTAAFVLFRQGSLLPTLRNANQAPRFVNAGIRVLDAGTDLELTPRLVIAADGAAFFWDQPKTLQTLTGAVQTIDAFAGTEAIGAVRWRPALNDNAIVTLTSAMLIPSKGLTALGFAKDNEYKADLRVILAF